ncbi:CD1247 N-terminal domain-containing protein [uncultured Ruminococcus sp.]|uniref:CD1247 N-terminal domain-containing protein n=1 Tax=uncultured Ruminococcus sp. TaxID=165186 RepID=UPI0025EC4AA0|nr:CD1247 N-terminal domain-containing protein [uncultured Ruminococcus sp.]
MKLTEKMSYLKGLIDGLEIDTSTKEGKVLVQMSEVMSELVLYVDDLQSQVDELTELCDILDEDLGQVEDDFYECDECDGDCDTCDDDEWDDDFDFDDDDDELYEITCPTCGDTILLDEGMIEEGSMNCPNCNELLEFDYDDLTIEDFEDKDEAPEKK